MFLVVLFFPNGGHENTFRMNYSCMPDDKIEQGIASLGKVLKSFYEITNK